MRYSISVPIGAWNDLLPATLKSLSCQSEPVQIALLDASNDPRVESIADEYDHLLAYRRHGPDLGQSDAIIEGWQNTDGEILGWLNADDSLFPHAMRIASERFSRNPSLDLVYGHSTIIDSNNQMRGYHFNVEPPGERLLEGCIISQPSCFFKRSAYNKVGGLNRDLHYVMDWDLWLRLYSHGAEFDFIDQPMSQVLWDENTKSASFNRRRKQELKSLINAYTPEEKRDGIFKAFAVHSYSEMIWPKTLRKKALRYLRRSGPKVFGVRADGNLETTAEIHMVHYNATEATKVIIAVDGARDNLVVSDKNGELNTQSHQAGIVATLRQPIGPGVHLSLNITRDPARPNGAIYLISAAWS